MALADEIREWSPMRREAWFQMLEKLLRRLPKAVGIRVAFEADSTLGPEDAKGLYVQRSATGEFVRSELTYSPQDESTPGALVFALTR